LYGGASPPQEAVTRFIENAPELGIDLGLIAAVVERGGSPAARVRQACMPVIGAGRTVMVFVSGPGAAHKYGSHEEQARERGGALLAAMRLVRDAHGQRANLIQALAEPGETWAIDGYRQAGLRQIAELLYLSRPMRLDEARSVAGHDGIVESLSGTWPPGVRVRTLQGNAADEQALERALDVSYQDTLDCPELAGLRTLPDIVASHRAVGEYDPNLWWLVEHQGAATGCTLLNHCPQQHCVELVYVGLAPALRGVSLGARLMESAIGAAAGLERELRCAVDSRNAPARRMYERLGFREVGRRIAFIAQVSELLERHVPVA
jgi:GNAT superfamily N-acetyltransferase